MYYNREQSAARDGASDLRAVQRSTLTEDGDVLSQVLQAFVHQAAVEAAVLLPPVVHHHAQRVLQGQYQRLPPVSLTVPLLTLRKQPQHKKTELGS